MEYLKNDICKFKPLFKVNYNLKKNLISCSFFKMGSHYKDFSLYVEGLEKLYYHVQKRMPTYVIRIFIDGNIYQDTFIRNKLNKLHKMEIVLFECEMYMENKYHVGLFASMVRFFPMFNFPNNDAARVIISDIDDIVLNTLIKYMNNLDENGLDKDLYFIKVGNINKNIYYNYEMTYMNTLSPYSIAQMTASFKRMDKKVILDYIKEVKDNKQNIKFSYYEATSHNESKFSGSYKNFIYGVDEYFVNNTLIKYLVTEKLPFSVNTKYEVHGGIFYWIRSLKNNNFSLQDKDIDKLKKLIGRLLKVIKKTYNNDKSIHDNYQLIDNAIYGSRDNIVSYELYKIIMKEYFNKEYNFVFTRDLYKVILTQDHFGLYEFDKISFFNSTKEDWFPSQKKFSHEKMDELFVLLNNIHKKKSTMLQ